MKVGINWTGTRDLPAVRQMIARGEVDFVEIMIDNFLSCSAGSLASVLAGTPCAFHIMNSRFLHQDEDVLTQIAEKINYFRGALSPIYISDHLGKFFYDGQYFPQMVEVDYSRDLDNCSEKLARWQRTLGADIFIENYPSIIPQSHKQAEFFKQLIERSSCNVLFDISNATIAEMNVGESIVAWKPITTNTSHFHLGGYAETTLIPHFLVDTHDCNIDPDSIQRAKAILADRTEITICVERDSNFDVENWVCEIERVRNLQL